MFDSTTTQPPTNETPSLKQQLFSLCDHYSEYNDYSAFFYTACSLIIQSNDIDTSNAAAHGVARFAEVLIEKSQAVNDQLQQLLHEA